MRILIVTDEEWNDIVYGNNILTNWFRGFNAEFAQIYCSPGMPLNNICQRYFRITDYQMVHSLFSAKRAGSIVMKPVDGLEVEQSKQNAQRQGIYGVMKKISIYFHTPIMMMRDLIWRLGRYDINTLTFFVNDFRPDIVFCPRLITPKLMRLETIVSKITDAPFVAFTADNEASLNHYSWSPLFWIRCCMIHQLFKKHVDLYNHYFMFSAEQAEIYKREYGLSTSCLYKCGSFPKIFNKKDVSNPIRMVYAGRLYCNRWKTLAAIGQALKFINSNGKKIYLDIYTQEELSLRQINGLNKDSYIYVHNQITPSQLEEEYINADIALHVESFDKSNRNATRYSFSTKIVDLMASSCAIMAICWDKHAGYQYLKEHDAAICIPSNDDILPSLRKLIDHPDLISYYAQKAWECGAKYHNTVVVQKQIKQTFDGIINQSNLTNK